MENGNLYLSSLSMYATCVALLQLGCFQPFFPGGRKQKKMVLLQPLEDTELGKDGQDDRWLLKK